MSREVRRVPMDWQHPQQWTPRWDRERGSIQRMDWKPLHADYAGSFATWEKEGRAIEAREGFDWDFWSAYCITGYKGKDDTEATTHPYDDENGATLVTDAEHLSALLLASHANNRPDPADYMPNFADAGSLGYCMYETCSEGTPISPVMESPEALARWLADNNASTFGSMTATYDQWLSMCTSGWAPSAVVANGVLASGVEFIAVDPMTAPTPLAEVHANTDAWWLSCAEAALAVLVKSRREFTTDDLRELGVGEPDSPARWGGLMAAAKARGDVIPYGWTVSKHPSRNGGYLRVWRGIPRDLPLP